jgi:hypothetical protein
MNSRLSYPSENYVDGEAGSSPDFRGRLATVSFAVLVFCGPGEQGMKVVFDVESVCLGVSYSSAFLDHPMFG